MLLINNQVENSIFLSGGTEIGVRIRTSRDANGGKFGGLVQQLELYLREMRSIYGSLRPRKRAGDSKKKTN